MDLAFFRNKKFIIPIFILVCFGAGILLGYYKTISSYANQVAGASTTKQSFADLIDKNIPTPPPDLDENLASGSAQVSADAKHLSVLLLGYGGAGHDGGYLSDTIILFYLDVTKHKLALIHVPRDIWVDVKIGSSSFPMKINGALAMGTKTSNYPTTTVSKDTVLMASSLTKQAVTTVTGLPIDFVVGVDFNGFAGAIETLKGIDVNVPSEFDDPWYPVRGRELELCDHTPEEVTQLSNTLSGFMLEKQFPCRYEQLHFNKGINHMNGETALKYGRSRHSSSDFDRGLRQIAIVQAVVNKLFTLDALSNIPSFFSNLSKSVKTDISPNQISIISPIIKTIPDLEVVEIGLDTTNVLREGTANTGAFILTPKEGEDKWDGTQKYIEGKL